MRILLVNPLSTPTFWDMEVTTRQILRCKAVNPPLGLLTVAAMLPNHWDLRLVDLKTRALTFADWDWANAVFLTALVTQRKSLLALISQAKQRNKIVVVGGPYVTSVPEEALAAGADFLVRGEVEGLIGQLIEAVSSGRAPQVFQENGKPDLGTSPIPRYDLLNMADYVTMVVQTSRGCPYDCEFCDITKLYGRRMRHKSPTQVLSELEALNQLHWRGEVFFTDDNFIGHKGKARDLLTSLIPWLESRDTPFRGFFCQASVELGQNMDLMDLMTAANFSTVFIGIESPDAEVLSQANKHHNLRTPLEESLNNIRHNGLWVLGSFIIGLDGEKPGADRRIVDMVERTGIPVPMINLAKALPNTNLWNRLEREGRLLDQGENLEKEGVFNFNPSRPPSEILSEYLAAYESLYEPSRFLAHAFRAVNGIRPTRRALAGGKYRVKPPESDRASDWRRPKEPAELGVIMASPKTGLKTGLWRIIVWPDLRAFFVLCWRQGVKSKFRRQFWRQLWQVWRNHPSRIIHYLIFCSYGENFIHTHQDRRARVMANTGHSPSKPGL